ncbi:MAG: hypothetical protein ACREN5_16020, partial [Gemmatimonadales bacterium]
PITGFEGHFEVAPRAWLRLVGGLLHVSHRVLGPLAGEGKVSTDALSAGAVVSVPEASATGQFPRALISGLHAQLVLRAVSGAAYTRLVNNGAGVIAPGPGFGFAVEPLFASRLPWNKYLDLRVEKRFALARYQWSAFLDVRNLFGWRNLERLFAETSDVTNLEHRQASLASEVAQLQNEAIGAGAMVGNDVRVNNCSTWQSAVNCVLLGRAEARFGNGDGLYTQAE